MNRRQRKEFLKEMKVNASVATAMPPAQQPYRREWDIGRNEKCPCKSGKKYKDCCLKLGTYEKYHEEK